MEMKKTFSCIFHSLKEHHHELIWNFQKTHLDISQYLDHEVGVLGCLINKIEKGFILFYLTEFHSFSFFHESKF